MESITHERSIAELCGIPELPTAARPGERVTLTPALLWLFTVTAGVAVANLTYNQPLLPEIGHTFGLAHAAVPENRRATYADGRAVMYGQTNQPDFRGLEGYEDHDVGTLFFWNDAGKLIAVAVSNSPRKSAVSQRRRSVKICQSSGRVPRIGEKTMYVQAEKGRSTKREAGVEQTE